MAITPLTVTIDLNPSYKKIPAVYVSQLDNNLRSLAITVQDGGVNYDVASSGYDVYVEGTKPDKHGFSYKVTDIGGTVVGSVVTVPMQTQMTCVQGMVPTEIVLKSGSDRIGSANFLLVVERAGLDEDTDVSETDIPGYIDGAQRAAAAAEDAKDLAVAAKDTAVSVAASIPADYTTLSNDVDDLKSALERETLWSNEFTGYKQGFYSTADGSYNPARTDYVCTIDPIPMTYYDCLYWNLSELSGIIPTVYISCFDASMNYIQSVQIYPATYNEPLTPSRLSSALTNVAFINLSLSGGGATLSPSTVTPLKIYKCNMGSDEFLSLAVKNTAPYLLNFTNIIYNASTHAKGYAWNRIGITTPFKVIENSMISVASGYKYAVMRFSSAIPSSATFVRTTGWITSDEIIAQDEYVMITLAKSDDTKLFPTASVMESLTIRPTLLNSANYCIGTDLIKRPVFAEYLGSLKYLQSFCKYDGKYYSTDGSNIAEQDSSFNVLRDVPISIGHGNSLQLGHNGKAYASGWNDQKVYEVDLATLTITNTYALPTTGYTTVAVDDVNELMYIFQRATYPDTLENYNFIVYDYANAQIISTKKTTVAFGAMQACDLFNDRIIVLNGTGDSVCPNGYRVFDLNGNILADYYLGDFSTQEPEGVCIDRSNHELLISYVDKKLYKLSI